MMIQAASPTPPGLGRGAEEPFCRRARARLLFALIAGASCLALACSDDDPALQTGVGGSSGSAPLDASARELPGDGREPTPDFDTDSRQREPIGPQQLVDEIDRIRNGNGQAGASNDAPDAAPGDADLPDGGAN